MNETKPHLSRIDLMLNAFSLDDEEKEQEKWGRRTPTSIQKSRKRPPSRQGLFPTHLNSSSFMPPTVPRSMTPRKRHPAEKRMLKRTNSSASSRSRTKKAVWVSRPRSRHRPPGESLFLRLPPKKGRKGGISEDRTSSKTRIIWGDAQDELENQKMTRRRLKLSKRKKKKKKKKKKKDDSDSNNEDDDSEKGEGKKSDEGLRSLRPKSRNLKSRGGVTSKIRRLGRRSVVSRRKHKSGKIQLLLLTDSDDSDGDSAEEDDDDIIVNRRLSHHSTTVLNDDHDVQNSKSTSSENVEDYEHGLETSSLDHGFLALFANRHESKISNNVMGK